MRHLLSIIGRTAPGAIACILAFGLGYGVAPSARPALLAERYGTTAYATLSAAWGVPPITVKALLPLAGALLWRTAGLSIALDATTLCCLLGAAGLITVERACCARQPNTAASPQP